MRSRLSRRSLLIAAGALAGATVHAAAPQRGALIQWPGFRSTQVEARDIWIWTPPGYQESGAPLPVIYMHDGQNLFDADRAPFGEWGVDECIAEGVARGRFAAAVVVGIANTPLRRREYMPRPLFESVDPSLRARIEADAGGAPLSDAYVRFVCDELKPAVEGAFRVRADRAGVFLMGSSMGGLISLETAFARPELFGAAACLSTHWPLRLSAFDTAEAVADWQNALLPAVESYVARRAPEPGRSRFWFDHGELNLDRWYRPYQTATDAALLGRGYRRGIDFSSRVYPGADHNEASWRARLADPLAFLLEPVSTRAP